MLPVRAVDRLVVLIVGLLLLVVAVAFTWGAAGQAEILVKMNAFLSATTWRAVLVSIVLFGLDFYLFWLGMRRRRQEKTILCDTALGEVRIAERAVQSLALRATRKVKGVRDATINVRATIAGLDIFVEATVGPDQSIPAITQEIRTRVAEYIRETVGVSVNSVPVLVSRVAAENRARVE